MPVTPAWSLSLAPAPSDPDRLHPTYAALDAAAATAAGVGSSGGSGAAGGVSLLGPALSWGSDGGDAPRLTLVTPLISMGSSEEPSARPPADPTLAAVLQPVFRMDTDDDTHVAASSHAQPHQVQPNTAWPLPLPPPLQHATPSAALPLPASMQQQQQQWTRPVALEASAWPVVYERSVSDGGGGDGGDGITAPLAPERRRRQLARPGATETPSAGRAPQAHAHTAVSGSQDARRRKVGRQRSLSSPNMEAVDAVAADATAYEGRPCVPRWRTCADSPVLPLH
jgi:hypothetical protein